MSEKNVFSPSASCSHFTEETSSVLTHRKHRRTHSAGLSAASTGCCSNGIYGEGGGPHGKVPPLAQPHQSGTLKSDSANGGASSTGLLKLDFRSHRRSSSYGGELFSSATREISEVASRVVEQAEGLVLHLWEQGWRVVHHTSLPLWLRDNDYLLWGHRPPLTSFQACFRSIFRLHTETVNIWTHLIGSICFLVLCVSFLIQPGIKFPWQEKIIISIFFLSAIAALAFSWLFHTLHCHSEHVGVLFSKLDYIGIALLTIGSFVPWLHYSFYCHVPSKIIYSVFIIVLGLMCIVISTKDCFRTPAYRSFRAGLFIALGLSGVIPCLHYALMEGFWETVTSPALGWLVLMAALYISGAVIYAMRIPERLYPGKFDIWFQSHQIFHVFVVLAALVHLNSILQIAETRLSEGQCRNP
ncbi:hypothetical protein AAHC03_04433 [Spirometra sp. Aus1]